MHSSESGSNHKFSRPMGRKEYNALTASSENIGESSLAVMKRAAGEKIIAQGSELGGFKKEVSKCKEEISRLRSDDWEVGS